MLSWLQTRRASAAEIAHLHAMIVESDSDRDHWRQSYGDLAHRMEDQTAVVQELREAIDVRDALVADLAAGGNSTSRVRT